MKNHTCKQQIKMSAPATEQVSAPPKHSLAGGSVSAPADNSMVRGADTHPEAREAPA